MGEKLSSNAEWTNSYRVVIAATEASILFLSYLVSLFLRYGRYVPLRNYEAFKGAIGWILMIFVFINILFGVYILYDKTKGDLLFITITSQGILAVVAMVLSFAGRWLAFPRSVVLIDFAVSVFMLYVFRRSVERGV